MVTKLSCEESHLPNYLAADDLNVSWEQGRIGRSLQFHKSLALRAQG